MELVSVASAAPDNGHAPVVGGTNSVARVAVAWPAAGQHAVGSADAPRPLI